MDDSHRPESLVHMSKEPYILSQEPYIHPKEPFIYSKEPYVHSEAPYIKLMVATVSNDLYVCWVPHMERDLYQLQEIYKNDL